MEQSTSKMLPVKEGALVISYMTAPERLPETLRSFGFFEEPRLSYPQGRVLLRKEGENYGLVRVTEKLPVQGESLVNMTAPKYKMDLGYAQATEADIEGLKETLKGVDQRTRQMDQESRRKLVKYAGAGFLGGLIAVPLAVAAASGFDLGSFVESYSKHGGLARLVNTITPMIGAMVGGLFFGRACSKIEWPSKHEKVDAFFKGHGGVYALSALEKIIA